MLCPDCGNEMEEGFLHAKPPVVWSASPRKLTLFRGEGDEVLLSSALLGGNPVPAAHLCRACRRVIVEY